MILNSNDSSLVEAVWMRFANLAEYLLNLYPWYIEEQVRNTKNAFGALITLRDKGQIGDKWSIMDNFNTIVRIQLFRCSLISNAYFHQPNTNCLYKEVSATSVWSKLHYSQIQTSTICSDFCHVQSYPCQLKSYFFVKRTLLLFSSACYKAIINILTANYSVKLIEQPVVVRVNCIQT